MHPNFGTPGGLYKAATFLLTVTALFLSASEAVFAASGNANPPHGLRVVDRRGRLVGQALTENVVVREVNEVLVTFYVNPATGIFDSRAIYLYYTTSDCSGTAYVTHYSNFAEGTRVGSKLYYPTGAEEFVPRSLKVTLGSGEQGACSAAPNVPGVFGAATSVDVNSFGLELPFRAVQ